MRIFEVTSEKYNGVVVYKFGDDDRFVGVDYSGAEINVGQANWIMKHLPANAKSMEHFPGTSAKVVEIIEKVDFQSFWDRYNDKARSSRVKTKKVWDRMPKSEQIRAYHFVPKYFASIPGGIMKKYATTYLNDQLWNNE